MMVDPIQIPVSLVALASARALGGDSVHLLDSALQGQGDARWSILALETAREAHGIMAVMDVLSSAPTVPAAAAQMSRGRARRLDPGPSRVACPEGPEPLKHGDRPVSGWSEPCPPTPSAVPADAPVFVGGWMFFLPYEAAWYFEPSLGVAPQGEAALEAFAVEVVAALVVDHHSGQTWLVARDATARTRAVGALCDWIDTARSLEAGMLAGNDGAGAGGQTDVVHAPRRAGTLTASDPATYQDAVRQAKDLILEGETFQLNLSRGWRFRAADETRLLGAGAAGPEDRHGSNGADGSNGANGVSQRLATAHHYARLRTHNPAPFACWFDVPGASILSSSPERLVRIEAGIAQVCPIAGTRPRGVDAESDERLRHELRNDPKEIAEHVMLVDLMRNDLGRVAAVGSVRVPDLLRVESYARVHHLVSTVEAGLRAEIHAGDVLRAVFPGGTITGCPKIQSIRRILELEGGEARGAYTGTVGYLSDDGRLDSNILIRTLVARGDELFFRTGAGIVADSDAERELAETDHKAQALLEAIGVAPTAGRAPTDSTDPPRQAAGGNR